MFILLVEEDGSEFPRMLGDFESFEEADFERMYLQPDYINIIKVHEVDGIEECNTFTEEG